jgi:hypothetical protein
VINDLVPKTKPIFSGVFDQNTGAQWVSDTLATFCDPSGIGHDKVKAINAGPKVGRGILVNCDLDLKAEAMFLGIFDQFSPALDGSATPWLHTVIPPGSVQRKSKRSVQGPKRGEWTK